MMQPRRLECARCASRHDAHLNDDDALERFAHAISFQRVPATALRIAGNAIAKPLNALLSGVLGAPGQAAVHAPDAAVSWVMHPRESTVAQLTSMAPTMGWTVSTAAPPHAGDWCCSWECLAALVQRASSPQGETFIDGGNPIHAARLAKQYVEPARDDGRDVPVRCGCGAQLLVPAHFDAARRAQMIAAHGWVTSVRGTFCGVGCFQRSIVPMAAPEPVRTPQPVATPAAAPPAKRRSR